MGFPGSLQAPDNGSQEGKDGCLKTNLVHVASVDVSREIQGDMYDDRQGKEYGEEGGEGRGRKRKKERKIDKKIRS